MNFLIVCGQYSKLQGLEKMGAAGRSGGQKHLSKTPRLFKNLSAGEDHKFQCILMLTR